MFLIYGGQTGTYRAHLMTINVREYSTLLSISRRTETRTSLQGGKWSDWKTSKPIGTCHQSLIPPTHRHMGSFSRWVPFGGLRSGIYYQRGNPSLAFKASLKFIMILSVMTSKEIQYMKKQFLYSIVNVSNTSTTRRGNWSGNHNFSTNTLWFFFFLGEEKNI